MFENKVLRKIFGANRDENSGEWRKLHNAELHALYFSPNIIRNLKTVALVPEFAVEDLPSQNCSLGSYACSEGPTLG